MNIEISKPKSTVSLITDKVSNIASKPLFIFTAGFTLGYLSKIIIDNTNKLICDKILKKVFKKKNN